MVTKRRIWIPGASYHITNRGNRREDIFLEEVDYYIYISLIKNTLKFYEDYNYKLISYCLMKNHVHILLKTDKYDPSHFMRRLSSMYAKYFNNKYECIGHLFQGRYYSNTITSVIELLEVSRYIHLNPVRANITKLPEEYRWSSYNKILEDIDIKEDQINKVGSVAVGNNTNISDINNCRKNREKKQKNKLDVASEEILGLLDIYLLVEENDMKNIKLRVEKKMNSAKDKYKFYVESKI